VARIGDDARADILRRDDNGSLAIRATGGLTVIATANPFKSSLLNSNLSGPGVDRAVA
jgi:hypothetical protein